MGKVSVPPDFFIKTAERDYCDPVRAFIREFLQNSRDAGATVIDFSLDWVDGVMCFICRDNGHGMTAEVVETKLMALGETTKTQASGATGGFGVAKILIFFAQLSYILESRFVSVTGKGDEYEIKVKETESPGTKACVLLNPTLFGSDIEMVKEKWKEELQKSDLRGVTVRLNGEEGFCRKPKGRLYQDLGWCRAYCRKVPERRFSAAVRVRGLHMFELYFGGSGVLKEIVVELEEYSTDCLTTNRDGFKGLRHTELCDVMQGLGSTIEPTTVKSLFRFVGNGPQTKPSSVSLDTGEGTNERYAALSAPAVIPSSSPAQSYATSARTPRNSKSGIFEAEIPSVLDTPEDFFVIVHGGRKIPASWQPDRLSAGKKALKDIWSEICRMIAAHAGLIWASFGTGFLVNVRDEDDQDALGLYFEGGNHRVIFVNSEKFLEYAKSTSPAAAAMRLVGIAVHEMAHMMGEDYHSTAFVIREFQIRTVVYEHLPEYLSRVDDWYRRIFPKWKEAPAKPIRRKENLEARGQIALF